MTFEGNFIFMKAGILHYNLYHLIIPNLIIMKTLNIDGLTIFEIKVLVQQGGKFVAFPNTVSVLLKKIKKTSTVYFIRPEESTFKYSAYFLFLNLIIGWWYLPWGPISLIKSLFYLFKGGKDVTLDILEILNENLPLYNPDIHYLQTA